MTTRPRTWGFRMSLLDGLVLAACPVLTWGLFLVVGPMAGVAPFAIGHFFLFCNVFRIRRHAELLWAGLAVVNVSVWLVMDQVNWWNIMAVQTPLTLGILIRELRYRGYHGVGARRFNPELEKWLAGDLA